MLEQAQRSDGGRGEGAQPRFGSTASTRVMVAVQWPNLGPVPATTSGLSWRFEAELGCDVDGPVHDQIAHARYVG